MTNPVYQATMRLKAKVAAPAAPAIAPHWRFAVGDAVKYVRADDTENHHHGQTGAVIQQFRGYMDDDDKVHDTHGGCYLVRFACGCESNLFEHWLARDGERACVQ